MKDLIIGFLVGIVIGFVVAICYYDGFVAKEYKDRIKQACDALERADKLIDEKEQQIQQLMFYIQNSKQKSANPSSINL